MNQSEVEAFVESLDNVEREESYGYVFYFVGDDHRLPFVSLSDSDNEYDTVSQLNREGVYRVNIRLKKETYDSLIGETDPSTVDHTVLNTFLPHFEYAKQHYVSILNPSGDNEALAQQFIREAHSIASAPRRGNRASE